MTTLLSRPPEEAARRIALSLLDRTEEAASRLRDGEDGEPLHDFRVAAHRLRAVAEAYRRALRGSVSKRHLRQLRELIRATGPGREADVAVAWLRARRPDLDASQRPGLDRLLERLENRRGAGYASARERLDRDFEPLAEELRQGLGVYTREYSLGAEERDRTFGDEVSEEAVADLERLRERLSGFGSRDDVVVLHEARRAAKRLRFLLEPLAEELDGLDHLIARLERLHHLLSEAADAHALEEELTVAVDDAALSAARRRLRAALKDEEPASPDDGSGDPLGGLVELARLNRRRRDRLVSALEDGWLEDGEELAELEAGVRHFARWLGAGFSPPRRTDTGEPGPAAGR